jgi:hypothetical protein
VNKFVVKFEGSFATPKNGPNKKGNYSPVKKNIKTRKIW